MHWPNISQDAPAHLAAEEDQVMLRQSEEHEKGQYAHQYSFYFYLFF